MAFPESAIEKFRDDYRDNLRYEFANLHLVEDESEVCPDCGDDDNYLKQYGVCECKCIEAWQNDQSKLSYEEFRVLFYKTV